MVAVLVACDDDSSSDFATHPSEDSSPACDVNIDENCMKDERDGQTYRTVKIGSQTWMAENLNYAYLQPTDELDSSSFCYKDSVEYCAKYGRHYAWAAAMDSVGTWSANGKGCGYDKTCSPTYPVRGICPEGWHLPDTTEWNALFTAVGGSSTAGKMLKSTSGWNDDKGVNGNGTDAYGFSALPAGFINYISRFFSHEGEAAHFWSSTEDSSLLAYYIALSNNSGTARLYHSMKHLGSPVRCVKDVQAE